MFSDDLVSPPHIKLGSFAFPPLESEDHLPSKSKIWLVACAGFEERALAAFSKLIGRGNQIQMILVRYSPHINGNKTTEIESAYLKETGALPMIVDYDRYAPAGFGLSLAQLLSSGDDGLIFIDISAMSRLLIVQIVVALVDFNLMCRSTVIYTEAETYSPSQESVIREIEKLPAHPSFHLQFLSSAVYDVTIAPELSSTSVAPGLTRLVAFPSFDTNLLPALQSELQPSRFTLIEGIPIRKDLLWRRDSIAQINQLNLLDGDSELVESSVLDYRDTIRVLLDVYREYSLIERILIAPTGSKMQTVGVSLFKAFVRDIQIVYPTASNFISPVSYTTGSGATYFLNLSSFIYFDRNG